LKNLLKDKRNLFLILENDLRYLSILPKKLLLDIYRDYNRLPAILDIDNVNEFRKIFDDSYYNFGKYEPSSEMMKNSMRIQGEELQFLTLKFINNIFCNISALMQRATLTGKKKPPPTRPYVLMLMLYDLLKREAKALKLHNFSVSLKY
jgi:hypothetical protein